MLLYHTTCRVISLWFLANFANSAILRKGSPLWWKQALETGALKHVRTHGVTQFINHYMRSKAIETPSFLWGDEIEYGVFRRIGSESHFDLSIRGAEIIADLAAREPDISSGGCDWQPEYGSWMVEAVPRFPYSGYVSDLFKVEQSMALRRSRLHAALLPGECAPSMSVFPMLGVAGYNHTVARGGPVAHSAFVSDAVINDNPRFAALTNNIRSRRGGNVQILLPLEAGGEATVDAMAFGMGCCCLQITMQCRDERESRFLHDQLAVLAPVFLALSASTPIAHGHLLDTDTRWDIISQSVDDRTAAERGVAGAAAAVADLAGGGVRRIRKSRYSSVSRFIAAPSTPLEETSLAALNDIRAELDEVAVEQAYSARLDHSLIAHLGHLFIRDPLVIFNDTIYVEDQGRLDHFENVQSTNWVSHHTLSLTDISLTIHSLQRTIRWKPPVVKAAEALESRLAAGLTVTQSNELSYNEPGWRVEFRPLEVQLTDFENAAFSIL